MVQSVGAVCFTYQLFYPGLTCKRGHHICRPVFLINNLVLIKLVLLTWFQCKLHKIIFISNIYFKMENRNTILIYSSKHLNDLKLY